MSDLGTALLTEIQDSFMAKITNDRKLKQIANKIRDGTDYDIANDYSIRIGELLSQSVLENTGTLAYMSEELAREVLTPILTADHNMVAEATNAIQTNMNEAEGIRLGVQTPELDTNRIEGLVSKLASYDTYEQAKWVMGEPLVNYSQSVVDQAIRDNARVTSRAGGTAYIIRETEAPAVKSVTKVVRSRKGKEYKYPYTYREPCPWCESLAGKYDYDELGMVSDVYRRHEACRCKLTFVRGSLRQNVWNQKETWTEKEAQIQKETVAKAQEIKDGAYYPSEIAGVPQGQPMTVAEADSGNVNPNYTKAVAYQINCQSCVVTYEARLRGYDVEVLPFKNGSMLQTLSRQTELAWKNQDGTPAQFLIGSKDDWNKMYASKTYYTAKTFEAKLKKTLKPGERYDFGFPWKGRGRSGHIVTMDISDEGTLHIYDPQIDRNYYGNEVSAYLKTIKYTQTIYGTKYPSNVKVMRVDDKLFNLEVVNQIMKAK